MLHSGCLFWILLLAISAALVSATLTAIPITDIYMDSFESEIQLLVYDSAQQINGNVSGPDFNLFVTQQTKFHVFCRYGQSILEELHRQIPNSVLV